MSLVSLSTAFIMARFEGSFLSPEEQKRQDGGKDFWESLETRDR